MSEFYIYLNGARRGPFPEAGVRQWLEQELLRPEDLAADGREAELKPLATFAPFAPAAFRSEETLVRVTAPAPAPAATAQTTALALPDLGPYSRATLAPGETPWFKTTLHWIIFVRYGLAALALFLFAAMPFAIGVQALFGSQIGWFTLPLPAFILVPPALAFASSELVITNRRVLIKTGIIRRQSIEMFIAKIESITVEQSFPGRILDYGTVLIRGTGGFEEPFAAIARPIEFRNCVQRMQSGELANA